MRSPLIATLLRKATLRVGGYDLKSHFSSDIVHYVWRRISPLPTDTDIVHYVWLTHSNPESQIPIPPLRPYAPLCGKQKMSKAKDNRR